MPRIRPLLLVPALLLLLPVHPPTLAATAPPAASTPALEWPGTDLGRRARDWFAQLTADEAGARRFLQENMAPSALSQAGLDARLERRRAMLAGTGGLVPLEVVDDGPAGLAIRCRAGNGDDVVATFRAEPAAPHRLLGVSLEVRPQGAGAGGRRARGPAGPPLDDAAAAQLVRGKLDDAAAAGDFSGVALLARDSTTLLESAWGVADRGTGARVKRDTRFNLASIGKLFTRTAIAQLAEKGRLSLDDPLSKYLPDFPHADSITVGMLCAHRSGVGDFFNAAFRAMDHSKLRHNRDYLPLIRDQPLGFAPGTSERYSNGGYVLLGEVIARASGEDYYAYLAQHVFGPAGMTATSYPIEGDGTPGVARGYTSEGAADGREVDNVRTRPARGSAAGGGCSTADDLLAFDRALFGARLCGAGWAAWVAGGPRPMPGAAAPPAAPMAGFAGGAPGISTEWMHEGGVTFIVLTNRDPATSGRVLEPVRDLVRRMPPEGPLAP